LCRLSRSCVVDDGSAVVSCRAVNLFTGSLCSLFFFLSIPLPPIFTLFPYTTLFRSFSLQIFYCHMELNNAMHNRTLMLPALKRRSEEHTSELQSQSNLVCRLLLEKKN